MAHIEQTRKGSELLLVNTEITAHAEAEWFDPQYWKNNQLLTGTAGGRGTTYFVQHEQQHWVLRHYCRGGLIGKVLSDQFTFTGWQNCRSVQEMNLLAQLLEWDLPCPTPIAGRVVKSGTIYRADIMTALIEDARDLHHIMRRQAINNDTWFALGQVIRQFHDKQVYHHDLNVHNIMLDGTGKLWLIDFDKCAIKSGQNWKKANLARLERSLYKEVNQHTRYYWYSKQWNLVLKGYHQ